MDKLFLELESATQTHAPGLVVLFAKAGFVIKVNLTLSVELPDQSGADRGAAAAESDLRLKNKTSRNKGQVNFY
ncbi:MAG: hypothetical protein LBD30_06280 [Verrucomicrobiales bacterium]|nr:hypothetical protein [Verrucomicrobiales bacterium]